MVAAAVVVLVTGGAVDAQPSPARVGATGTELTLDGSPWWPVGFNAYQLATDWSINRGCGAQVDLDAYFSALPGVTITRFNAFSALATNKFTGAVDFAPVDAVFAAAERHGQFVIPVLTAQDGACEDDVFKQRDWYVDGWQQQAAGMPMSFQDWVTTAVARWRSSPALAAWELVGEPETSVCPGGNCDFANRVCPPDAAEVLRTFMDDAGALVRAQDPYRLITAGLTGGGQCGTQGDEFQYVGESPNVDVLQYHDYHADGIPLPGDQWNGLARRIDQVEAIGKPLLVAEIGQAAGGCLPYAQRAADIGTKIAGQRVAGTAGALLWAFVPDPRHDDCTYDIGPGDPLYDLLAAYLSDPPPA
ncbi:beta-mannosidase [Rhodococcus gannanensis]|uniref:Beta-mannosidase n=1 Tax=Rhodococcus gannanensis TaxID=1960308 RepID=A0ABW4PCV3_9NOCA